MQTEINESADFTPTGLKIVGRYENDRNAKNAKLFKDIVREVFNVTDVIVGHHIVYEAVDRQGKFDIQVIEEIPSADSLIFDHTVIQQLFGEDWSSVLTELALTPPEKRDDRLSTLYYGRSRTY